MNPTPHRLATKTPTDPALHEPTSNAVKRQHREMFGGGSPKPGGRSGQGSAGKRRRDFRAQWAPFHCQRDFLRPQMY